MICAAGTIDVGGAGATPGQLHLPASALQLLRCESLAIDAPSTLTVYSVSATADLASVGDVALTSAASEIVFAAASSWPQLSASATSAGVIVHAGADLSTTRGDLTLNGGDDSAVNSHIAIGSVAAGCAHISSAAKLNLQTAAA